MRRCVSTALAATLLMTACDTVHGPSPPDRTRRVEGVVYRAELVEAGPDVVAVTATITNLGDRPSTAHFSNTCLAFLRAYFPDGRRVWDGREGRKECRNRDFEISLAGGETRTLNLYSTTLNILGFSLPGGDYRITTYFLPAAGDPLEIDVGLATLEAPGPRGL